MKLLIAEDDRLTRRSLERQLSAWGHEVVCAEDGVAAWEHFERDGFELVISDWEMPRMDGVELIGRIRADHRPSYVYVVMLTARAQKQDLVEGMEAGADDFLTKPFDKGELRARLRAGERVIRLERTLAEQNRLLQSANDRMNQDLEAAARVQQSILPERAPDVANVECAWRYVPCDALAGDALNVFALDDRTLCGYVLDVSGHGVPAALLSVAVARSLGHSDDPTSVILAGADGAGALGPFARPCSVATRLNQRFPFEANGQRFFTMIYSLLDVQTGRLAYCCAGHPGPVRIGRDGGVTCVDTPSLMVGVDPDPGYEDESLQLTPGDRLYFYSDGIVEQQSRDEEEFGKDRFVDLLRRSADLPLQASIDAVVDRLRAWAGRDGFTDDVSLMGVAWKGEVGSDQSSEAVKKRGQAPGNTALLEL